MRRLLWTGTMLSGLLSSFAHAVAPVQPPAGTGRWQNREFTVRVVDSLHLRTGASDSEKVTPPFSPKQAVLFARPALRKLVGDAERLFAFETVRLCRHRDSNGPYGFYVVELSSDHAALIGREQGQFYPVSLPFIVYFDGVVELPVAVEPDNPREPVLISVTPTTAQESRRP